MLSKSRRPICSGTGESYAISHTNAIHFSLLFLHSKILSFWCGFNTFTEWVKGSACQWKQVWKEWGIDVRSESSCLVHGPKGLKNCVGPTELYCILHKEGKNYKVPNSLPVMWLHQNFTDHSNSVSSLQEWNSDFLSVFNPQLWGEWAREHVQLFLKRFEAIFIFRDVLFSLGLCLPLSPSLWSKESTTRNSTHCPTLLKTPFGSKWLNACSFSPTLGDVFAQWPGVTSGADQSGGGKSVFHVADPSPMAFMSFWRDSEHRRCSTPVNQETNSHCMIPWA